MRSRPDYPRRDHYESYTEVPDHFYSTPHLTSLPPNHRYFGSAREIRYLLTNIYRRHNIRQCPRYGLYYAGPKVLVEDTNADRILLLVIELRKEDIQKWRVIDREVREILGEYGLDDPHGVCPRYYKFNKDARVEQLPSLEESDASSASSSSMDTLVPAFNQEDIHQAWPSIFAPNFGRRAAIAMR